MKKVMVEPIARVEGHGGIEVVIEENKVKEVKIDIYEGPRLIEQLVIGKTPDEDVSITSRICAICFVSHRLAAITGLEKCLGIKVPEKTKLLRRLAHYGEIIESNSLHYYLLALPDLVGYPDAIKMTEKYGAEVKGGLELKKFGNRIMEIVAGRRIHGENMRIGGFGKVPSSEELLWIKKRAIELIPEIERGIDLWTTINIPDYMEDDTIFVSLLPEDGRYGFTADTLKISDGTTLDVEEYKELTNERVVPHSFGKRCRYKGKPYSVGALARIINQGDRLTGLAKEYFNKLYSDRWKRNPLYNNIAQAIEILYCLENIPSIVDRIMKFEYKDTPPEFNSGRGTGAVEAPRGTLFHSYEVKDGKVTYADFIAPTTQNYEDIEKYMRKAAENLLKENAKELELPLEIVVRAFDPCISCSAHLVRVKRKS